MLGYITHSDCLDHDTGDLHPDTGERLDAISNQLIMSGLDYVLLRHDAPKATREQLLRVHTGAHVDRVFRLAWRMAGDATQAEDLTAVLAALEIERPVLRDVVEELRDRLERLLQVLPPGQDNLKETRSEERFSRNAETGV